MQAGWVRLSRIASMAIIIAQTAHAQQLDRLVPLEALLIPAELQVVDRRHEDVLDSTILSGFAIDVVVSDERNGAEAGGGSLLLGAEHAESRRIAFGGCDPTAETVLQSLACLVLSMPVEITQDDAAVCGVSLGGRRLGRIEAISHPSVRRLINTSNLPANAHALATGVDAVVEYLRGCPSWECEPLGELDYLDLRLLAVTTIRHAKRVGMPVEDFASVVLDQLLEAMDAEDGKEDRRLDPNLLLADRAVLMRLEQMARFAQDDGSMRLRLITYLPRHARDHSFLDGWVYGPLLQAVGRHGDRQLAEDLYRTPRRMSYIVRTEIASIIGLRRALDEEHVEELTTESFDRLAVVRDSMANGNADVFWDAIELSMRLVECTPDEHAWVNHVMQDTPATGLRPM